VTGRETLALVAVTAPALTALVAVAAPRRVVPAVAVVGAVASGAAACALATVALVHPAHPYVGRWVVVDAAGGLLVGVIGLVGLASALVSPAYLATASTAVVRSSRRLHLYYGLLFAFWALLVAVPVIGNLGGAWLLIEATTAASALLVGFSGRPRALEAGW
jgi:hydrogenase-4 component F